jgi:hypothetical protein
VESHSRENRGGGEDAEFKGAASRNHGGSCSFLTNIQR